MNWAKSINYIFERDLVEDKAIANTVGVAIFVILMALGAYVRIPLGFTPVPITLQTFFVILAGAILGKKLGALSQIAYVILGGLGLPIFAGAGYGLGYLAGPTGGYLLGFVISAFFVGHLIDCGKSIFWKAITLTLGLSIIYLCGVLWLSSLLSVSLHKDIILGIVPFIPGALIKLVLAIFIYLKFSPAIKKTFLL